MPYNDAVYTFVETKLFTRLIDEYLSDDEEDVNHLRDLASAFHSYYAAERFLVDDVELSRARVALLTATAQVLRNGLSLLGVSAPEKM